LTIANRTDARAAVLAEAVAGTAIPLSGLTDALKDADVVFGAAGAGHFLLNPGTLPTSQTAEPRPLLLIDLTVPRTFDPILAGVAGVALADMDDLNGPAAALRGDYEREVRRVEELLEQGVAGFHRWRDGRRAAPTIAALQHELEQIRTRELERALVRLGHLSERDRDIVKALSVGLANKVLHRPVTALQHDPDPTAIAAAARTLFGLDESTPEGE
jgi:glutamyl-tRNA reductase